MQKGETISHEGIVVRSSGNGTSEVEIVAGSACSRCHAQSACSLGNSEVKIITVRHDSPVSPGDKVIVTMKQSQGFRALFIGYVLPFIVLVTVFAGLTIAGAGELASALLSFAALAVYYVIVWLFRKSIEQKFEFKIKN